MVRASKSEVVHEMRMLRQPDYAKSQLLYLENFSFLSHRAVQGFQWLSEEMRDLIASCVGDLFCHVSVKYALYDLRGSFPRLSFTAGTWLPTYSYIPRILLLLLLLPASLSSALSIR